MSFNVRRVVTGHDDHGCSTVLSDTRLDGESHRSGESSRVLWVAPGFPADNDDATDRSAAERNTAEDGGSVFRVIRYEPGVAPRQHRTSSIDFAVVLSGSIQMVLDRETVELNAGDMLVQRGTIHDWINAGPEPCVIAFALIGARPATSGGEPLSPIG